MRSMFPTLFALLACVAPVAAQPAALPKVPPAERLVGIAYGTWHRPDCAKSHWGTPELGFYLSDNRAVIRQHAKWLADAGVDFVWEDWSNNVKYTYDPNKKNVTFDMIEGATTIMFDEFAAMRGKGEKTPNISIFAGVTGAPESATDGRLQKKADQIYREYIENPKYKGLWQNYLGKPLLVVYVNTPSPWQTSAPPWNDDRFTVRWMTGYVTEQKALRDGPVSKFGFWSWEDRGDQTYTVHDGKPETMVVVASYREQTGKGPDKKGQGYIPAGPRANGATFKKQWARAREIGPKFAMVVSWNEWHKGEQPSAEISKDIEPSREFGHFYLDLMKEEIRKFKSEE